MKVKVYFMGVKEKSCINLHRRENQVGISIFAAVHKSGQKWRCLFKELKKTKCKSKIYNHPRWPPLTSLQKVSFFVGKDTKITVLFYPFRENLQNMNFIQLRNNWKRTVKE